MKELLEWVQTTGDIIVRDIILMSLQRLRLEPGTPKAEELDAEITIKTGHIEMLTRVRTKIMELTKEE